ncbi:hypothetical protein P4C99_16740 [Pontiellaceae bacterium B1224]|nr:hypothetical protein [Pontiellaceae bacterium B1224]
MNKTIKITLRILIITLLAGGTSADVISNGGSLNLSGKGESLDYIDQSFSTANGLVIEFDFSTWKTGFMSDGFTLALFDADTTSPTVGAFGGSLGYANRSTTIAGLSGGVLGIGFDAHGNFSSDIDGKTGGNESSTPNSVSLRGSESSAYAYIAGTSSLSDFMNNSDAATEAEALTRNVRITVSAAEQVTVEWKTDGTESWETLLDVDASAQMDLTDAVKVGITKSFNDNINAQISNLTVIPEPAIISLCLVFGGGLLIARRIFGN